MSSCESVMADSSWALSVVFGVQGGGAVEGRGVFARVGRDDIGEDASGQSDHGSVEGFVAGRPASVLSCRARFRSSSSAARWDGIGVGEDAAGQQCVSGASRFNGACRRGGDGPAVGRRGVEAAAPRRGGVP